ncbi:hypothetical protein DFJ73DRAFT_861936 [Zopfochytrium polystomum]|nr:hypothetical protein DFJ73DRAFT_861936 [Zopfochytrium polystomum]
MNEHKHKNKEELSKEMARDPSSFGGPLLSARTGTGAPPSAPPPAPSAVARPGVTVAAPASPAAIPTTRNVGRIGNNSKNFSNDIFRFGGSLGFQNDEQRYARNVAEQEKIRAAGVRENRSKRYEIKRNWMAEIEETRWRRLADQEAKELSTWTKKHSATKLGSNSVNYNPITLAYHDNEHGESLAREDAKALFRTAVRAAHLYVKNNSFDPLRCQDIPRRLEKVVSETDCHDQRKGHQKGANASLSAARTTTTGSDSHWPLGWKTSEWSRRGVEARAKGNDRTTQMEAAATLSAPEAIISLAAQTAQLVKQRLPEAEARLVLQMGVASATRGTGKMGGGSGDPVTLTTAAAGAAEIVSVDTGGSCARHH